MFLAVAFAHPMKAQQSKEDKKKEKEEAKLWKKKAKTYAKAPLSLRDDLETANRQLKECSDRNKTLQGKFAALEGTIDSLQNALNAKNAEMAALNTKYEKLQAAFEAQKSITVSNIIPGLIYHVQVGAYVHFDMNQHLVQTDKTFEGETRDGMNKYMMGNFKDLKNAEAFRDDVRKLGIKDAFVVPYIDGTRVTMDEAAKFNGGGKGLDTGDSMGKGTGSTESSGKEGIKGNRTPTGKEAIKTGGN
jgi:molecular chaperone GrpE (heat shock protein)